MVGIGAVTSNSTKQKINTQTSTEATLVGVDEELSKVLWARLLMLAQGWTVNNNILYQDNQATMKLAKNGKRSSGKRTKHIDIQYFYVTYKIAAGDVTTIGYCPTKEMVADYFTKPLQ